MGTYYDSKGISTVYLTYILGRISKDKALEPDNMSDRWIRKQYNQLPLYLG